jgi:uncharacterized protein YozE (UPF0346 family)
VFYQWLLAQRERRDDVGRFAVLASQDKTFPRRSHRLFRLLRYYSTQPQMRQALKQAHAEWRAAR